ncbi:importin subunit alpha-1 isoform X3 [Parasteatoda tepidariorum]|uniref:importin subunit alpha-1 isoform X3 n=1 Tax=Parasteatoda tepidariorum TaxID=114398 RepID=UPI0039BCD426
MKDTTLKDTEMSMEEIVRGICSQDAHQQFIAAQNARKILSRKSCPPIDAMIATGVVPYLVQFLICHDNIPLQFEACWAVANITSGNFVQRRTVVEAGAVPNFASLLSSPHANVAEKAVWALRKIAGDGVYCDLIIGNNIIPPLQALLTPDISPLLRRNITGIFLNICINMPPPFDAIMMVLPSLAELINDNDQEVVRDSLCTISCLTEGSNRERQEVVNVGILPRLCELLKWREVSILLPALSAVGNIICLDDEHAETVINVGALQTLLRHPDNSIVEEACSVIFNTAGTPTQIQALIDDGLVDLVIDVLRKDDYESQNKAIWAVKSEAIWVIKSITSGGTIEQIIFLINAGVIPPVCNLLVVEDSKILTVALDALANILNAAIKNGTTKSVCCDLEQYGGLDRIKNLIKHEESEVYKSAFTIIGMAYFAGEFNNNCDRWSAQNIV